MLLGELLDNKITHLVLRDVEEDDVTQHVEVCIRDQTVCVFEHTVCASEELVCVCDHMVCTTHETARACDDWCARLTHKVCASRLSDGRGTVCCGTSRKMTWPSTSRISHKVFTQSFRKSQFSHKSVNLFLIQAKINDKSTYLYEN